MIDKSLRKEKSTVIDTSEESSDTSDPEDESTLSSATEPAETTISQLEAETSTYNTFLADTLVPTYGLADFEVFRLNCEWWAGFMDLHEFMPEDRKGIVSARIEDLNGDGSAEMIVVISGTFADPVVNTSEYDDYVYETHYDGIEIKIYHLVGGVVQELLCDNRSLVYDEVFMYPTDESFQVCVVGSGTDKYVYVYNFNLYCSEQSADLFYHDVYQITDTGIHCVKALTTTNGIIYDALDPTGGSMGTETFNIWSGDLIGNYFTAIQSNLTPYGIDCSWMNSYYDIIVVDSEFKQTTSKGKNLLFTPLSAMVPEIEVIAMAGGRFEHDPDTNDPIQHFSLLNMVEGPIAQPVRLIPFPNTQVESEVLSIRETWTQDRANITAGIYTSEMDSAGITAYYNGGDIVMIEIAGGTNGVPYSRTYEYANGQLIFAFFDRSGSGNDQRLYFYNGVMFRWNLTYASYDPIMYDNSVGHPMFIELEKKALEEGMQALNDAYAM